MTRHHRFPSILSLGVIALSGFLAACGNGQPMEPSQNGASAAALEGSTASAMIVYTPKEPVDESGFFSLGAPESLGGKVLEGNPRIFARIDFYDGKGKVGGLFKATAGKIEITFPFTEHATILEGEVTITDATGQSHTFKPGDSYFMRQGQVVIWDVKKEVIKSFFNITELQSE